jgi:hypothetical protein
MYIHTFDKLNFCLNEKCKYDKISNHFLPTYIYVSYDKLFTYLPTYNNCRTTDSSEANFRVINLLISGKVGPQGYICHLPPPRVTLAI